MRPPNSSKAYKLIGWALGGLLLLGSVGWWALVRQLPNPFPVEVVLGPKMTEPKVLIHVGQQGLFLAPDGSLWMWGQADVLFTKATDVPRRFGTTNLWRDIAVSENNAAGIWPDGTLRGWGESRCLPPNNTPPQTLGRAILRGTPDAPVLISADRDWQSVIGLPSGSSFCALKTDGTLWTWGHNNSRLQLGRNDVPASLTPLQIGTEPGWVKVAADAIQYFAIKRDGTLWRWGDGNSLPEQLGTFSDWADFAAHAYCSFGVRKDGSLWAMGPNVPMFYSQPELAWSNLFPCGHISPGTGLAVGTTVLFERIPDGTVKVAGVYDRGLFGDGGTGSSGIPGSSPATPILVPGLTNCQQVWAGGATATALTQDNTLWLWGYHEGQRPITKAQRVGFMLGAVLERLGVQCPPREPGVRPAPYPLMRLKPAN